MTTRRTILQELALAVPLWAAWRTGALAAVARSALDPWARRVVALNRALAAGEIGLLDWQDRIAALNTSVPVGEIVRYLEIEKLAESPPRLCHVARSSASSERYLRVVISWGAKLCTMPAFEMKLSQRSL